MDLGGIDMNNVGYPPQGFSQSLGLYTPNLKLYEYNVNTLSLENLAGGSLRNLRLAGINITGDGGITSVADNTRWFANGGSTTLGGYGALLILTGKLRGDPGQFYLFTPNAALNADVQRLTVSGGLATAVASWTNITHNGITLSGNLDADSQQIINVDTLRLVADGIVKNNVDNSKIVLVGGNTTDSAVIYLFGKSHATPGRFELDTPNAALTGITRMTISGGVNTAVATWSAITHTGFKADSVTDNSAHPATVGFIRVGHGIYPMIGRNNADTSNRNILDWGVTRVDTLTICGDGNQILTPAPLEVSADVSWLPATDNQWSLGSGTKRLKLVRAVTITPGDLLFENGWKLTEADRIGAGEGIALVRPDGSICQVFN